MNYYGTFRIKYLQFLSLKNIKFSTIIDNKYLIFQDSQMRIINFQKQFDEIEIKNKFLEKLDDNNAIEL